MLDNLAFKDNTHIFMKPLPTMMLQCEYKYLKNNQDIMFTYPYLHKFLVLTYMELYETITILDTS